MSEDFPAHQAGSRAGSLLAGYRLEAQVGAGGMAVVYRARDERLARRVALKILAPAFASDAAFRQRFIRESQAAAAVDDPHIIPVYEAGEASGELFIAMRYVPGGDVRSLLAREGPLPSSRVAALISPVASALDAAHAAGLVHRDVKPANMLLDARPDRPDHVYLSDFGLSKGALASLGLTGAGQLLGTPDYMAPEQIEGLGVDGRADQYALACTAFELLTGEPPFQRDNFMAVIWAHRSQPPPSLAERRPALPASGDQVFARALAKAPGDRYASCREFADALREALGLVAYHTGPGGTRPPADHPPASHPPTEIGRPAVATVDKATPPNPAPAPAGLAAAMTMDSPPSGPADVAEMPAAVLTTDPGHPSLEADDDARPLAPTATAIVDKATADKAAADKAAADKALADKAARGQGPRGQGRRGQGRRGQGRRRQGRRRQGRRRQGRRRQGRRRQGRRRQGRRRQGRRRQGRRRQGRRRQGRRRQGRRRQGRRRQGRRRQGRRRQGRRRQGRRRQGRRRQGRRRQGRRRQGRRRQGRRRQGRRRQGRRRQGRRRQGRRRQGRRRQGRRRQGRRRQGRRRQGRRRQGRRRQGRRRSGRHGLGRQPADRRPGNSRRASPPSRQTSPPDGSSGHHNGRAGRPRR